MKRLIVIILCLTLALGWRISVPSTYQPPLITMTYTFQEYDENGKLVCSYTKPSDSYVIAFADALNSMWRSASNSIIDTSNTSRSIGAHAVWAANAAATDATYGIIAGTGTNAVALSDYSLQNAIAHGTGAGQLSYGITVVSTPSTTGTTRYFNISRVLTNNSGGTITINEIGIVTSNGASALKLLMVRDLIAGGQAVTNTHTATITYTIGITV